MGSGGTIRVLIADDSVFFRKKLVRQAEAAGMTVIAEAADGVEAVAAFQQFRPDVVSLDVAMPTLNGSDAARTIAAAQPDACIVMLGSLGELPGIIDGLHAGARGYVVKPFGLDGFCDLIRKIRASSERRRHPRVSIEAGIAPVQLFDPGDDRVARADGHAVSLGLAGLAMTLGRATTAIAPATRLRALVHAEHTALAIPVSVQWHSAKTVGLQFHPADAAMQEEIDVLFAVYVAREHTMAGATGRASRGEARSTGLAAVPAAAQPLPSPAPPLPPPPPPAAAASVPCDAPPAFAAGPALAQAELDRAAARRPAPPRPPRDVPAICFVSDSAYMLRMVEMRLHDLGVSVTCFRDTALALQVVDRGDADIVIIDDRWKDNTPYELSRQVKTRGPDRALTLLLTENLTRREVQSAAQAGIDRILLRPQPLGVILRHVNEAFRNAGFGALKLPKDLAASERGGCRGRRAVLDKVRAFDAVSAVPGIVERVLAITNDDSGSTRELAQIIRTDPNTTAAVLKRANSASSSGVRSISDPGEAISRLGFRTVRSIVMGLSVIKLFAHQQQNLGFDRLGFWKACVAAAVFSREIVRQSGVAAEEDPFIIGLLADFGKIVLDECLGLELDECISTAVTERVALRDAEMRVLEVEDAEVAATVLAGWSFPEKVVGIVRRHEDVSAVEQGRSKFEAVACAAVAAAKWLTRACGAGDTGDRLVDRLPAPLVATANLTAFLVPGRVGRCLDEITELAALFNIPAVWERETPSSLRGQTVYMLELKESRFGQSPLQWLLRGRGADPIPLMAWAELGTVESSAPVFAEAASPEAIAAALSGKGWADRPWTFLLPRPEPEAPPLEDRLQQAGLPLSRGWRYLQYPLFAHELA